MSSGKLYGVGVGPGASDLMTLRSVQVLNAVDVIAAPLGNKFAKSVAWRIAEPNIDENPEQEQLFLTFPMTKNPEVLKPAWEVALKEIGERLTAGKSLAFITEGDPLFFSTFTYMMEAIETRMPEVEIEVVPAVSSFTAVPSVINANIADGQERVAVVPASYGLEELPAIFKLFDTILLMKVSSIMPQLVEILEKENLLDRAVYISKATMKDESIIYDLKSIKNDRCDYFSMVMIKKNERNGVLAGK